ncbi:MAG: cation:proton antiporter, partial [Candidatus Omnitrophica bacterium]|nr:cation:proton antiporter [Candidatus Omnitrophota bacterium]
MSSSLVVGIIIVTGFVFGKIADRIKLPKVTGYVLAGLLLNPRLFSLMPEDFVSHTDLITNISLSFITFSIGGTLLYSRIKSLGKTILYITVLEAEFAFIAIFLGLMIVTPFLVHIPGASLAATIIPLSILISALGSPTDPTATLAVTHQYGAKGEVSSTILGVAASDDALGLMNYSLAVVIARVFVTHAHANFYSAALYPLFVIIGSLALGVIFGFIFNLAYGLLKKEPGGLLIVLIFGLLSLCFGTANFLKLDELLTTMMMGAIVTNYNKDRDVIFDTLRLYAEELIFVLFFTLSGMQLNFAVLKVYYIIVIFFVVFRMAGKISGTVLGAYLSKSPAKIKRYAWGGLIP